MVGFGELEGFHSFFKNCILLNFCNPINYQISKIYQKAYKLVNRVIIMITQVDKLGRIVLKKKLREKYGDRFIVIPGDGEIVLRSIRIDRDKLAEKLDRYSLSRLKEMAYEQAMDDVEERLLKKK